MWLKTSSERQRHYSLRPFLDPLPGGIEGEVSEMETFERKGLKINLEEALVMGIHALYVRGG